MGADPGVGRPGSARPGRAPEGERAVAVRCLVKPRMYRDSVELMGLSAALRSVPGVRQAVAIMATERNKATLEMSGLLVDAVASARPDDLLVVVEGETDAAALEALARAERMLVEQRPQASPSAGGRGAPRTLEAARRAFPDANLALVSVPGPYAAYEAEKALRAGLHVHVFSDNVELADEVRLKRLGRELGLLVMGPDCGTCLIGGVPLGFANAVARGPIGIVGASGTGIQEVSVIIDRLGSGISHAIGTGSRDLSDEVGGITTLMALDALDEDPDTSVIVVVSKPPGARAGRAVLERARACRKPVVVNFLGAPPQALQQAGVVGAATPEEAAVRAVALARGEPTGAAPPAFPREDMVALAAQEASRKDRRQRFVRGLFSGGTLAQEALWVLERRLGAVWSNAPLRPEFRLPTGRQSRGHCVVDLGDDEFTRGRPHPMVDPSYRAERLLAEAADPEVAVILCDVVLGFGAHPDPAGELARAVTQARRRSAGHLTVVASVCGTSGDPQNLARQEQALREAGVLVFPSNAAAAEAAAAIAAACAERKPA